MDSLTRDWIRNPSDERAAANGCRFDAERGEYVCTWIETYCRLYEGDWAGQPLTLLPWARDVTMRLFGWVRHSEKWGREVRRFREASIFVAKKNGKSPWLAAVGLYLLAGDGEPGQKVFLCARDGTQARDIAGKHAVEMLRQSDALMSECSLNRSTLQITHLPSRSLMVPLSSSNASHQQSKEGLNGSVLIDEVHVVDRDFVRRISRAGISRSEPLQIEVSTAGNNPDGYGRERFDYSRHVERGADGYRNDALFVAIYAAPQDLSDTELEADPMKFGRMANPAMGTIVDEAEYLADYAKSKNGIQSLADFKMYRLNIWQKGSNPWLNSSDWSRCRRDYTADDLAGRDCCAGLDLSRSRDMTAFVFVFPWPEDGAECFRLLPFFWIPQRRAEQLASIAPLMTWGQQGYLTIVPGDVIDFRLVRETIKQAASQYNLVELAYDPKFATELALQLQDEDGLSVFAFDQSDANFAAPTLDFERGVTAGTLQHNGHPVLDWQAGHVQAMIKVSKVKRAVKESAESPKTIDGIIAAIMGLARAQQLAGMVEPSAEIW